jgi:hypothetical protein
MLARGDLAGQSSPSIALQKTSIGSMRQHRVEKSAQNTVPSKRVIREQATALMRIV